MKVVNCRKLLHNIIKEYKKQIRTHIKKKLWS